jgi:hypothetical protein
MQDSAPMPTKRASITESLDGEFEIEPSVMASKVLDDLKEIMRQNEDRVDLEKGEEVDAELFFLLHILVHHIGVPKELLPTYEHPI